MARRDTDKIVTVADTQRRAGRFAAPGAMMGV